jgi:hypothetical protein
MAFPKKLQAEGWLRIVLAKCDLFVADINFTTSNVYQAMSKGNFRLATTFFPSSGVFQTWNQTWLWLSLSLCTRAQDLMLLSRDLVLLVGMRSTKKQFAQAVSFLSRTGGVV